MYVYYIYIYIYCVALPLVIPLLREETARDRPKRVGAASRGAALIELYVDKFF